MNLGKLRITYLLIAFLISAASAGTITLSSGSFVHGKLRSTSKSACEDMVLVENDAKFFALFDGHGGRRGKQSAVTIAHKNLKTNFEEAFSNIGAPEEKILTAFKKTSLQIDVATNGTGSTAVMAFFGQEEKNPMLYIANLGDSRAILGTVNSATISVSFASTDHRYSNPEERKRIDLLRRVSSSANEEKHEIKNPEVPPPNGDSNPEEKRIDLLPQLPEGPSARKREIAVPAHFSPKRQKLHDGSKKENKAVQSLPVPQFFTPFTLLEPHVPVTTSLNPGITRRFGFKDKRRKGIIDIPDVTSIKLTSDDLFLILVSDGITDFLDDNEMVNIVAAQLNLGVALDKVSEELAKAAAYKDPKNRFLQDKSYAENTEWKKDIRDDMSAVVIRIDHESINER